MNSFLDVTANQRSSVNANNNYSDVKPLSPKLTHTPLAQQSNNTNHAKALTNQHGGSKNQNRRKSSTYQTNGKKRNFNGSQNSNVGVSNHSVDNRQYQQRVGNNNNNNSNSSSNQNATVSGKKGDKLQTRDSFDSAARSSNATSSVGGSSSSSEGGGSEGSSNKSNKDRISRSKTSSKSPNMDIRPVRLMISHPSAQHNQPHMSILSPNGKSIYSLDYVQQMNSQVSDRYRTQQTEYLNSNGNANRVAYSNERNNGTRYSNTNGNGGNRYSIKTSAQTPSNNASVSPPLSITSSGSSSTNSGKNSGRTSKSYNNGNTIQSMNSHRNIPTTPTMQQTHTGFFQSQNIPFYHTGSANGMPQIFSSAISPTNQTPHSTQTVGLYVQQNTTTAYHPNNNYHNHNRNYHGNGNGSGNGNKKNWHFYNSKSKPETNGNYSSSNSSTASSTHSNGKPNASKSGTSQTQNKTTKSVDNSLKKPDSADKMPVKKLANKSTQVESPPPDPKTFSLSDSETCTTKVKQLPPSDYFRLPKSKAASSPVINLNSASVSHTFLSSIDNDTFKKTGIKPEHYSAPYENVVKSPIDPNPISFTHNQRTGMQLTSRFIQPGTMLTEDMLLNGSVTRMRYMNPQNMHLFSDANAWTNTYMSTNDCYVNSPTRTKNFQPNVAQQKRRSGTNSATGRKSYDFDKQRGLQYRSRQCDIKIPSDLCNGSEWDALSQQIWAKFDERKQPQELYEKKIALWGYLSQQIKTLFPRNSLYLVGSTVSGFALDTSDVDMCLVSHLESTLDHRSEAVFHLDGLKAHLQEHCQSFLGNFNLIPAKVPILRFDDTQSNIEVDLNYNNCVGIRNSYLLYCYTQLDWRLQPLAIIVKLWARHHDINNAKDLTISSYSLTLMVIHYLQCGVQPAILPSLHALYPDRFNKIHNVQAYNMDVKMEPYHSGNTASLGELFAGFLEYYCKFNYERYAISVRTAGLLPIEECRLRIYCKNDPTDWKQLCIEEPFDRSNTARSCCDEKIFDRIKKVFSESWLLLSETKDLDHLFKQQLGPPAFCTLYDNYTPIYQNMPYQPMDYILR